jgi:hypothetical protein
MRRGIGPRGRPTLSLLAFASDFLDIGACLRLPPSWVWWFPGMQNLVDESAHVVRDGHRAHFCQSLCAALAMASARRRRSRTAKGRWRDNVLVERLWRTVEYEEVYLKAYGSLSEARRSIGRYLDPHSSFDGATPHQAYFTPPPLPIRMSAQLWQARQLSTENLFRQSGPPQVSLFGIS